eukprot:gene21881-1265_t
MAVPRTKRSFNFLLTQQELIDTPSAKAGVAWSVEDELRHYGCELIQNSGILLRLSQVVMARAMTLLHRFYYRRSLTEFDVRNLALASLFLSTKLEEQPKKVRHILTTYDRVMKKMENPKEKDPKTLDIASSVWFGSHCLSLGVSPKMVKNGQKKAEPKFIPTGGLWREPFTGLKSFGTAP